MTWGVEPTWSSASAGPVDMDRISFKKETYSFVAETQGRRRHDSFKRYYGPTMNAFEAAGRAGKAEELHGRLLELARAQNKGTAAPRPSRRPTCG